MSFSGLVIALKESEITPGCVAELFGCVKKIGHFFYTMKTSESREQQIFLVTGGIILILILGVVGFDVIDDEGRGVVGSVSSLPPSSPPVVAVAVPEKPDGEKKPWIDAVKVAPVFQSVDKLPPVEPLPEKQKDTTIIPLKDISSLPVVEEEKNAIPSSPPLSAWHPNAGALESARLTSQTPLDEVVAQYLVDIPNEKALLPADDGLANEILPDRMDSMEPDRDLTFPVFGDEALPSDRALSSPVERDASKNLEKLSSFSFYMLKLSPVLTRIPDAAQDAAMIVRPLPASVGKLSAAPIDTTEAAKEEPRPRDRSHLGFWVRLASFSDESNALGLLKSLREIMFEDGPLPVSKSESIIQDKIYYRVQMGPFADHAQAEQAARIVRHHTDINGIIISPRK